MMKVRNPQGKEEEKKKKMMSDFYQYETNFYRKNKGQCFEISQNFELNIIFDL